MKLAPTLAYGRVRLARVFLLISSSVLACEGGGPADSDPNAVEFTISPKTATLQLDETSEFTAVGIRSNGDTAQITVTWSATSGTIIDTSSQGGRHYGHYKKATCGNSLVVATSHPEPLADTAAVSIPCVASMSVSPASASVPVGGTVQLTAIPEDAQGNALAGRAITWASSATAMVAVSSSGLVSGVAAGSATITATSEGQSGSAALTVTAVSVPVAAVVVTSNPATVQVGATVQLTAIPEDAQGNALAGRAITWASSVTAVATVSSSGLVSGVAVGSATITATSEGKSGTAALTVTVPPPPGGSPVVWVGAGDIASCSSTGDEATATLLDNIAGTVFTAGDNAYSSGTATEFANCYDPSWGRHKARTKPSPGNHDYGTSGATGYYGYYGALAGPAGQGYYSYDLGDWHLISLNSNISMSVGSPQEQWLRADLAASTKQCTLAYWHHPRFSSGTTHGSMASAEPLWQALYDFGAEIVVSGHEHNYERFAPQTPTGAADPSRGIREFVVGTGGASHYKDEGTPLPNSEVFDGTTWGVLKLTLSATGYSWTFVPVAGASFTDSGTDQCH